VHLDSVRWALIGVAVCMSGLVLVFSFWPAVRGDQKLVRFETLITQRVFHVCRLHLQRLPAFLDCTRCWPSDLKYRFRSIHSHILYRCGRCTGTGSEIVGAPTNFEVRAPGSGPRSFSWTDYWIGTDCLVKSSVPPWTGTGPKLSVHRLTGPGAIK
jgi:Zn finger protein HypA/HybF involved in hydrogenase expression